MKFYDLHQLQSTPIQSTSFAFPIHSTSTGLQTDAQTSWQTKNKSVKKRTISDEKHIICLRSICMIRKQHLSIIIYYPYYPIIPITPIIPVIGEGRKTQWIVNSDFGKMKGQE